MSEADRRPDATGASGPYPVVEARPHFPDIEKRVLARWQEGDVFRRSIAARPSGEGGSNEFVIYDGPPFANGLPHYGHLITSYVKDIVPRFQTMRGRRVERRFGWDCHGLPAELEAEKELIYGTTGWPRNILSTRERLVGLVTSCLLGNDWLASKHLVY